MIFEWDERKNRANIRKPGFDLADPEEVFRGGLVVRTRHAGGLPIEAVGRTWLGSRLRCARDIRRAGARENPSHITKKGNQS